MKGLSHDKVIDNWLHGKDNTYQKNKVLTWRGFACGLANINMKGWVMEIRKSKVKYFHITIDMVTCVATVWYSVASKNSPS